MRRSARIGLVTATLVGCVGCDQVTKGAVRSHLALGESHAYLHDLLRLTHAENTGAFLGLGDALPASTRAVLFTGVVGILCVAPLLAALLARGLGRWPVQGLALFASGGFGNWIDRLTRDGHVTDFLNVGVGPLRTGIFNVADLALLAGAVLCVVAARDRGRRPPQASDDPSPRGRGGAGQDSRPGSGHTAPAHHHKVPASVPTGTALTPGECRRGVWRTPVGPVPRLLRSLPCS